MDVMASRVGGYYSSLSINNENDLHFERQSRTKNSGPANQNLVGLSILAGKLDDSGGKVAEKETLTRLGHGLNTMRSWLGAPPSTMTASSSTKL
jgi:hypothetical protein